jgi:membrane-associated phospholipid phosphatase
MDLDRAILHFLATHRVAAVSRLADHVMVAGSSKPLQWILVIVAAGLLAARQWWRPGVAALLALGSSDLMANVLKNVIARPRPPVALSLVRLRGWSMPSTQAALTAALSVAVWLSVDWATARIRWAAAAGLTAAVLLVGLFMLYLGGHWPTDVLVGWVLGAGLGIGSSWAARRLAVPPAFQRLLLRSLPAPSAPIDSEACQNQ